MGLFDRFKKKENIVKKETAIEDNVIEKTTNSSMPIFNVLYDGRTNVEFYNGEITSREFYDITHLTIDTNNTMMIAGKTIYNCVVAWDGHNDCRKFDFASEELRRIKGTREDYRGVWIELDLDKLRTDANYCKVLSDKLLLKSRVNKMLEEGLKEDPKRPCGKYIGGVHIEDGMYKKYFDLKVGIEAHNKPLMIERRAKLIEKEAADRAARIANNKKKIEDLQRENESLSGR